MVLNGAVFSKILSFVFGSILYENNLGLIEILIIIDLAYYDFLFFLLVSKIVGSLLPCQLGSA